MLDRLEGIVVRPCGLILINDAHGGDPIEIRYSTLKLSMADFW